MSTAALYLNPEAFDTRGPALMGRQSAGESFLRGHLQHARTDRFAFWDVANRGAAELRSRLEAVAPITRPLDLIGRSDRRGLARAGNVHLPQPNIAREAWQRRTAGLTRAYGISGITHTTAGMDIMDSLADLLTCPVEPWDTLICTSNAVRISVETQLEAVRADLEHRLGATRIPTPHIHTIPLGINTADFEVTDAHRAAWRARLDIPDDAVVVLYVGRFNAHAKMNPVPMAMALERAAQASDRPVVWVQAGWAGSDAHATAFHDDCRRHCPSVGYRVVDGREPETRFSIWSVGDVFLSLTDNVQETFGLTPLEAMAAGLPCVVSDWNGYRDTVRHEVDGFRIATYAPAAGTGGDLAYQYANSWIGYDQYVGAAAQVIAVDVGEAARALGVLIDDPDRRRAMGQAGRARARAMFDWAAVIPQYEAMWAQMQTLRRASVAQVDPPRNLVPNPRRMDPFHLFGNYATEWLTPSTMLILTPGQTPARVAELMSGALATYGRFALPTVQEAQGLVERLSTGRQMTAGELVADVPIGRRTLVQRGLLWLVKYDVVTLLHRARHIRNG